MKHNKSAGSVSMGKCAALGAAVSAAVTFLCAAVGAAVISSGVLSEGAMDYLTIAILLVATLIGAMSGAGGAKEKRLYVCLLVAVIYFGVLLAMTALIFDGQYDGVIVTAVVLFSGSIVAAMAGKGKGKRVNLRRSKIKRR